MNFNSNKLPKGLISLERKFNSNDQAMNKGSDLTTAKDEYTPITIVGGKTLNLGKVCNEAEQEIFITLCQEFNDAFY